MWENANKKQEQKRNGSEEEDHRLVEKIRTLSKHKDVIIRQKQSGDLVLYTLEQHSI